MTGVAMQDVITGPVSPGRLSGRTRRLPRSSAYWTRLGTAAGSAEGAIDITQLIFDDHHEQRRLFAILEQVDRADTRTIELIWARLSAFIEVHAAAEEETPDAIHNQTSVIDLARCVRCGLPVTGRGSASITSSCPLSFVLGSSITCIPPPGAVVITRSSGHHRLSPSGWGAAAPRQYATPPG